MEVLRTTVTHRGSCQAQAACAHVCVCVCVCVCACACACACLCVCREWGTTENGGGARRQKVLGWGWGDVLGGEEVGGREWGYFYCLSFSGT